LFGVLKEADPALVDPGVTARLECLLDDVVVGKQEMHGAIDAVCEVAQRIIGKLKDGAAGAGVSPLGAANSRDADGYPPTPAMKRFANSLVRQGIKPPAGYQTSISICRKFLNEHAPKKAAGAPVGMDRAKPRRVRKARKPSQQNAAAVIEDGVVNPAAIPDWTDAEHDAKPPKPARCTSRKRPRTAAARSGAPKPASRKR